MSVKFLIGGSPCTKWSIAQKNGRETEAEGIGWELFKNFLIAKEKFQPDFFLYENNKSAAQPIKDQISNELKVSLQYINSALVSAQNRERFYGHNIPNVPQPEDRGILLKDILETNTDEILENVHGIGYRGRKTYTENWTKQYEARDDEKANALTTATTDSMVAIYQIPHGFNKGGIKYNKTPTLTANGSWQENNFIIHPLNIGECETIQKAIPKIADKFGCIPEMFNAYNIAEIKDKSPTLSTGSMATSSCAVCKFEKTNKPIYQVINGLITIKDQQYPINLPDGYYIIRKLTPIECERLQTLPDNYTAAVSNSQRYKGCGNGWTAEVIIHILKHANIPLNEEIIVLSMYDGIGTGRYCFDKMGYKNVKYFATEIDKYPIQVAMSNYPNIIQLGDAFQVRNSDWKLSE